MGIEYVLAYQLGSKVFRDGLIRKKFIGNENSTPWPSFVDNHPSLDQLVCFYTLPGRIDDRLIRYSPVRREGYGYSLAVRIKAVSTDRDTARNKLKDIENFLDEQQTFTGIHSEIPFSILFNIGPPLIKKQMVTVTGPQNEEPHRHEYVVDYEYLLFYEF